MHNPYISIIIPIRNEEKYIYQCLKSITNQKYDKKGFEVLVIDGISTDRTTEIVEQFVREYSNIKMLMNPAKIPATALNIGVRAAKGNVIIRVDGHAVIAADYIAQCVKYLHSTGAECVCGWIKSTQTNRKGQAIALGMSNVFGVGNARFRTNGREGYVDTGAFLAYRREVFDRTGLFYENLVGCEDEEFHYRLQSKGGKIYFTPKIQSSYYTRSTYQELFKQYFRYGHAKVDILKLNPRMMQFRHFVPPIFVVCFVASLLMSLKVGVIAILFPMGYFVTTFFASALIGKRDGWRYIFFLPMVFYCLHFSYGSGFIIGITKVCLKTISITIKELAQKISSFLLLSTNAKR